MVQAKVTHEQTPDTIKILIKQAQIVNHSSFSNDSLQAIVHLLNF